MLDNILFYIVFLSQIILVSYYYPSKILNRMRQVLEKYPPESYPKLYPKPDEYYEKWKFRYRIINLIIMLLGFIILIAIGYKDFYYEGNTSESIPVFYFMVQSFPLILMEISGFAYFKLMRKADVRTTRKADLQPRRLFDFVSPVAVGFAILTNIACLFFFFYINEFQFYFGSDAFVILLTLLASNAIYIGIIYFNLYGKKQDPYQDSKDRTRQVEVTVKSLVFMSIAAGIFLTLTKVIDSYGLESLEPIAMSIYLQFILVIGLGALLRKLRIENINFEVYRVDTSEGSNEQNNFRKFEEKISYRNTIIGLCVGLVLGLSLGILILLEGGTLKGFVLPAMGGIILGTVFGGMFDLRRYNK